MCINEQTEDSQLSPLRILTLFNRALQALMVVAHKSSTEEIGILRKLFQKFDSQGDGSISYEEFCEALADAGHSEEDLKCMFEAVVRSVDENSIASLMDSPFANHLNFSSLGFGRLWANSLHGVSRCNH
jgi:hypothetical protein